MRSLIISFIVLSFVFLFLQSLKVKRSAEKPVFLRTDEIALNHNTALNVWLHSQVAPDSAQIKSLKIDYSNIWAHLNHLYSTNDVNAGKEYYTEKWFQQITKEYQGHQSPLAKRKDIHHDLHITNWSRDGLLCTAIDSNLLFTYTYPNAISESFQVNLAVVLLFQGDHWRIDALKVLDSQKVQHP